MFGVRILTFERYHEKNHIVGIILFRFDHKHVNDCIIGLNCVDSGH